MRVLNRRHSAEWSADGAIYVGRPTKFGNRHVIGYCKHCRRIHNRADAIQEFRNDLNNDPKLRAAVERELVGQDLVCWCAPLPCHADVLLEVANSVGV